MRFLSRLKECRSADKRVVIWHVVGTFLAFRSFRTQCRIDHSENRRHSVELRTGVATVFQHSKHRSMSGRSYDIIAASLPFCGIPIENMVR